jgi:hypothetical protein
MTNLLRTACCTNDDEPLPDFGFSSSRKTKVIMEVMQDAKMQIVR